MIEWVYVIGGWRGRGKTEVHREKKCSSAILSYKNPTWTGLGLNPTALLMCFELLYQHWQVRSTNMVYDIYYFGTNSKSKYGAYEREICLLYCKVFAILHIISVQYWNMISLWIF